MTHPTRWPLAALLLAGLAPPVVAAAQSPRQRAAALLQEGNTFHDRGEFATALDRYHRARALYPSYKIELNLGQTLEALGRAPEAAESYARFVAGADRRGDPRDRPMIAQAREKLAALQVRLARLTLSCPVAGARVEVDGEIAGQTPLPGPRFLAPGRHEVRVTAEGYVPHARRVDLTAGDHRYLAVSLLAATPPTGRTAPRKTRSEELDRRVAPPIHQRWWFWTLIGAAVVGGTVGVVVGVTQGRDTHLPRGELGDFTWSNPP